MYINISRIQKVCREARQQWEKITFEIWDLNRAAEEFSDATRESGRDSSVKNKIKKSEKTCSSCDIKNLFFLLSFLYINPLLLSSSIEYTTLYILFFGCLAFSGQSKSVGVASPQFSASFLSFLLLLSDTKCFSSNEIKIIRVEEITKNVSLIWSNWAEEERERLSLSNLSTPTFAHSFSLPEKHTQNISKHWSPLHDDSYSPKKKYIFLFCSDGEEREREKAKQQARTTEQRPNDPMTTNDD